MVFRLDVSINYAVYNLLILFFYILLTYLIIFSYYDISVTEIRKLINAIDNKLTVFNYSSLISEKLREIVVLTNDNKKQTKEELVQELKKKMNELEQKMETKLEKQIEHTKEFAKQNVELKEQIECIMKYIGVEQDNKKEKDNEEE